jgi:choline dehydrogenase-like flavoprotein
VLRSANPLDHPGLLYHYLEHPFDRARLRWGLRFIADLLRSAPFRALGARRTAPDDEILADDAALDQYMSQNVHTCVHMSTTARMGASIDDSVVDQFGRVHGVEGLRVADTSIAPSVVRRSTNATAVMIGERIAGFFND